MTTAVRWIGGALVSSCMRWCADVFRSTTAILKSSSNLSSWKKSVSHVRCQKMPSHFLRVFSSKIQNRGLCDFCDDFSFSNHIANQKFPFESNFESNRRIVIYSFNVKFFVDCHIGVLLLCKRTRLPYCMWGHNGCRLLAVLTTSTWIN